jgi:hypothetical protein
MIGQNALNINCWYAISPPRIRRLHVPLGTIQLKWLCPVPSWLIIETVCIETKPPKVDPIWYVVCLNRNDAISR